MGPFSLTMSDFSSRAETSEVLRSIVAMLMNNPSRGAGVNGSEGVVRGRREPQGEVRTLSRVYKEMRRREEELRSYGGEMMLSWTRIR